MSCFFVRKTLLLFLVGLGVVPCNAGWFSSNSQTPPTSNAERMARAGCPRRVAPWARGSEERFDQGYFVGGGVGYRRGEVRTPNEGVWGWDYDPPLSRVQLQWGHGRYFQGGGGQYRTNAPTNAFPKLVPKR